MKIKRNLVVLDLETTGTWIEKDKIVEIAMIKCTPSDDKEVFHKRLNPRMPIPEDITRLIGISDEDVKDAPVFQDVVKEVLSFIGDSDFGGFNVERFDLPLLEREINECGYKFNWREKNIFDAQKIYHLNEKRDLTAAYDFYCGKKLINAHSALADSEATLDILERQVEQYCDEDKVIDFLGKFNYRVTAEFFDSDRKFRWWNGKLYMMFGKYAKKYTLQEVASRDPKYLEWIMSADFAPEIKALVKDALKGIFPQFKEKGTLDKDVTIDEQATLF